MFFFLVSSCKKFYIFENIFKCLHLVNIVTHKVLLWVNSLGIYILIVQGYFPAKVPCSLFDSSFLNLLVRRPEFN